MPTPPPITEAEWTVMDALWEAGAKRPQSAQDVHAAVGERTLWSLGTVKTLLSRLAKKGAVLHESSGKRFLYRPAFTRQTCVRSEGKDLLNRAGRDGRSPLLAYFLKYSRIDRDEIRELRELLDQIEERRS